MWIQVRTMDGKQSEQIDQISKLTKVDELRELISEKFGVLPASQRLFFRGKQMKNGYKLFDYDVGLNDIIQLMERVTSLTTSDQENKQTTKSPEKDKKNLSVKDIENQDKENAEESDKENIKVDKEVSHKVDKESLKENGEKHEGEELNSPYKVGDPVDVQDFDTGAWFEAKVMKVMRNDKPENEESTQKYKYVICFDDYNGEEKTVVNEIRPRARKLQEWEDLALGDIVMANYNLDKPSYRGFWFDCVILGKKVHRNKSKELKVRLLLGPNKSLEPCKIKFVEEIFLIEKPGDESGPVDTEHKRKTEKEPDCLHCLDNTRRKCKECGCHLCGEKKDFDKTLLCDECNLPFHTFCLDPPLESLPEEDDWYCPLCRRDSSAVVNAQDELKMNKKKSKMKSASSETNRDWGKGMACVGRSKICTIVPPNHFGPIPGVPVGTLWKFRVQVSEAGVHRPHVSGIHGKESEGAYSIVLAGGYEDDEDNGDEFTYTGSGGRDLSGNKRTAEQSCDQVLTKSNLAIARTCHVKVDAKNGAESDNWKKSRPIRVVRNYKGAKHSKYAPEEGNRYDGLYKVVKYWPSKGKSGFIVWRFLFRRDDPDPAPWSKSGKKRSATLGIAMQYPDGYLENLAKKNQDDKRTKKKNQDDKGTSKRKLENGDTPKSASKKSRNSMYSLDSDLRNSIKEDLINKQLWDESLQSVPEGQKVFYEKVQELFACVCCQDVVHHPVTTTCKHNVCKLCLQRSFKAEIFSCPVCRAELGTDYEMPVNKALEKVLSQMLPGYGSGR